MTDNSMAPLALIPKSDDGDFLKTVAEAPASADHGLRRGDRQKPHSTNTLWLNKEVKRWADVVGIFLNEASTTRLVRAVLMEQNNEWQLQHRYLSLEPLPISVSSVRRNRTYLFHPPQYPYICRAWPERLRPGQPNLRHSGGRHL
jgi:hypothetical protein